MDVKCLSRKLGIESFDYQTSLSGQKTPIMYFEYLAELAEIVTWNRNECEKVKFQSRCDELNSAENVRIHHQELHKKHLHRSSILPSLAPLGNFIEIELS